MSNRAFEQLKTPGLTPDGRRWLTTAIDPFHDDLSVRPAGMPDYNYNSSIVKVHNRSFTLRHPTGLAEGSLWNAWIGTYPTMSPVKCTKVPRFANGNITYRDDGEKFDINTVTAFAYPEGETWFDPTELGIALGTDVAGVSPLPENGGQLVNNSLTRLIGGGFEISNDTAALYAQGHLLAYSTTNPPYPDQASTINEPEFDPISYQTSQTIRHRRHPDTVSQAKAIQNCVNWKATEGVYVPFRMNLERNQYSMPTAIPLVFSGSTPDFPAIENVIMSELSPDSLGAASDTYRPCPNVLSLHTPAAIHNSGAIFTGLSYSTTLTVTVRFIEEVAPIDNEQLLSYSASLEHYDPVALEFYNKLMTKIPVAVTFDENASAEFWSKVLNAASKIAPIVGTAFGHPMIGNAVGKAAAVASQKLKEKAEREKARADSLKSQLVVRNKELSMVKYKPKK